MFGTATTYAGSATGLDHIAALLHGYGVGSKALGVSNPLSAVHVC